MKIVQTLISNETKILRQSENKYLAAYFITGKRGMNDETVRSANNERYT